MKKAIDLANRPRRSLSASPRAGQIARRIVEEYLERQGGEDSGFKFEHNEELLAKRIAHAIERAAGGH